MNGIVSLLGAGFWTKLTDFITGIFAVIPQFIYFFYTCVASVLDALQYLLRKLAGLDSYYINGVKNDGDILTRFVNGVLGLDGSYSALNTVFWSMMLFGIILLILGVIISMIRAHYNYDEKKSRPSQIIGKALKNIATMAIVPIVTILGVYLANIFLKTLDTITASSSVGTTEQAFASSEGNYKTVFVEQKDEWGQPTYVSYDFFGSNAPTGNVTISGILFKAAANNCNRVRYGAYSAADGGASLDPSDGKWSDCGIFNSTLSSPAEQKEAVAYMIDYAFANNLRLNERKTASILKEESLLLVSSFKYLQSRVWYAGTIQFKSFSKYNVGLVWYYYNLWQFNFLIAFIGITIAITFLSNIVFGLVVRLLECTALLICLGPVVGMGPLEDGKAFGQWKQNFVGDVMMAYGAIFGINLMFMMLPHIQSITFFNNSMLNAIMDMVIIITCLLAVKQTIALTSSFVGGKDAYSAGSELKKEVGKASGVSAEKLSGAAVVAVKVAKLLPGVGAAAKAAESTVKKIHQNNLRRAVMKQQEEGSAKVSQKIHDELKADEIEKKKQEKEELEREIEDSNKGETSEESTKKADELENEANATDVEADEEEKESDKSAAHFNMFLGGTTTYGSEKFGKDSKLAAQLKKEYLKDINKKGVTSADRKTLQREYVEKFKQQNSHAQKASSLRNEASEKHTEAAEYRKTAAAQQRIEQLDNEIETMSDAGYVMDGYEIKKSHMPKSFLSQNSIDSIIKFGGETIKAFGSITGFDKAIESLGKETKAIDNGHIILKDFAQKLGVQASQLQSKTFQTQKEQESQSKGSQQQKLVVKGGEEEGKEMYKAVLKLEKALRDQNKID